MQDKIFEEFQLTPFEKIEMYAKAQLIEFPEQEWETAVFNLVKLQNDFEVKLDDVSLHDMFTNLFSEARKKKLIIEQEKNKFSLSFKELMEKDFPKARYTMEPLFEQGTVNMVSAPPNTWKSWFLFYVSAYIAEGSMVWNKFSTEQSPVMIINEEDSHRAVQDRFKLLNISNLNLPIYFHIAKGLKIDKIFVNTIIKELKDKKINVLILDSLRAMHQVNENDSTEMQEILDNLKEISRQGITVIFTHHNRKKSAFEKGDVAESIRGSSAINAAVSGHISLEEEVRDSGTYLIVRHLKSKAGEKLQPFELRIEKGNGKVDFKYEGDFKDTERKILLAKDSILNILSNKTKYQTVKDFVSSGIAGESVIRQAIKSLMSDTYIASLTRADAQARGIIVGSLGKANEILYYMLEHKKFVKDEELDGFGEELPLKN